MCNKFTMQLVWHNCFSYPPKEEYNNSLYVTDGISVWRMLWDNRNNRGVFISPTLEIGGYDLKEFWWADIDQTVRGSFKLIK